jgi:hypothetical protein
MGVRSTQLADIISKKIRKQRENELVRIVNNIPYSQSVRNIK